MAKKKDSRLKRWAWRGFLVVGILLGLALVFNEQIKLFVVDHMSQSTLSGISKDSIKKAKQKKGSFDFDKVSALDLETVAKAAADASPDAIGMIAVPTVNLSLPILHGMANNNMAIGAGTMKPDQEMGKGNYALAGHDITTKGVLFSPLDDVKLGEYIYITDLSHVYKYKITVKETVEMTEVQWVDDVKDKKLITLVTCELATDSSTDRLIVQGELVSTKKATNKNIKVFKGANIADSSK